MKESLFLIHPPASAQPWKFSSARQNLHESRAKMKICAPLTVVLALSLSSDCARMVSDFSLLECWISCLMPAGPGCLGDGWMSEATEQPQTKRDSKGTRKGLARWRLTAMLAKWGECGIAGTFLCLKHLLSSMPCYRGGMGGEGGPQKLKSFKNISQKSVNTSRYLQ